MAIGVNSRIIRIEAVLGKIPDKRRYTTIVEKDKTGVLWFKNGYGERVSSDQALELYKPGFIIIRPTCIRT